MLKQKMALIVAAFMLAVGVPAAALWAQAPAPIKIGNTAPYSGPASGISALYRALAAYFHMVNDHGGVSGRKIEFISYDDGYSPPRTVAMTRRLVEQDHVLFVAASLGTPTNTAVWKYLNDRHVPQLFIISGDPKWDDPKGHPWTMAWIPTYQMEGEVFARYILEKVPNAKVGVLYQNDDYGRACLVGLKRGLGKQAAKLIVMEQSYETTEPTVESQIVNLHNSGANVLFDVTVTKYTAQAIRKAYELDWHPIHLLPSIGSSIGTVLKPAGLKASTGLITTQFVKDPDDPHWRNDPGYKNWLAFMRKYDPAGDVHDQYNVWGYSVGQTIVHVLGRCGNDLTPANVMRQAERINHLRLPMLLPGVTLNTSPHDFHLIKQLRLARFDGERWVQFGKLYTAGSSR